MSIDVMSWVWKHSKSVGNDRLVLLAIADNAEDDGSNSWPKQSTLARKTGLSEDTVRRAIRRLVELGELEVDERAGGSEKHEFYSPRHRPHAYRVVMAVTPQPAVTPQAVTPQAVTPQPAVSDPANAPIRDPAPCTIKLEEPSEGQPSVEPSLFLNGRAREATKPPEPLEGFDAFWETYPRKTAKADARKAWPKAVRAVRGNWPSLITAARRYADDPNREAAFTLHPTTWLNGHRWDDPPLSPRTTRPGSPPRSTAAVAVDMLRRNGAIQ